MFFKNIDFDPLNAILINPTLMKYGLKPENILVELDEYIAKILSGNIPDMISTNISYDKNILTNFSIYGTDMRSSIMYFLCCYKYQFGEKTTLSTFAGSNHKQFGYNDMHSAKTSVNSYKQHVRNNNRYLMETFEPLLNKPNDNSRPKSIPIILAQILTHAICKYPSNPTNLSKFNNMKNRLYDIETLKDFIKSVNFTTVDEYIFERVYHIKLICEILNFYNEFVNFINNLSEYILTVSYLLHPAPVHDSVCKYFDVDSVIYAIREYSENLNVDIDTIKNSCIHNLNIIVQNLCRFSLIDDVYTRTDVMISCIKENSNSIMDVNHFVDAIKHCVSLEMRNSIIKEDIFYYGTISHSLLRYVSTKSYDDYPRTNDKELVDGFKIISVLLKNNDSSLLSYEEYLGKTIDSLSTYINNRQFNLNIKEVVDNTIDNNYNLNKLLIYLYDVIPIIKFNNKFHKYNFFDDDFYQSYHTILDNQMHRIIDMKLF